MDRADTGAFTTVAIKLLGAFTTVPMKKFMYPPWQTRDEVKHIHALEFS